MKKTTKKKPSYRQLTDREHRILQAWEKVPKELWSCPDLFTKSDVGNWMVHNKAYDAIMTGGVEALGFSIARCFDFCLDLISQLDQAENDHLDSVAPLLSILQEHNKIYHYCYEKIPDNSEEIDRFGRPKTSKNEIVIFEKKFDQHYYNQPIRETNWIRKWSTRFGKHSFECYEDPLIGYRSSTTTIKGQDFVLSDRSYGDVQIYPEVERYLRSRENLNKIQFKFWAMARASVVLFDIDDATKKSMNFMPCRIQFGDKSFYLRVTKDDCDMMLEPKLESHWSLDGIN